MKTLTCFIFLIIIATGLLFIPSLLWSRDSSFDIALDLNIPGKGGWTTCDTFARYLYEQITKAGGEAYYIVYDWKNEDRFSGRHAFVVYRDSKGRFWGTDQRHRQPQWLTGKDPKTWTEWFASPFETQVVYVHTDHRLTGKYADLTKEQTISDPGLMEDLQEKDSQKVKVVSHDESVPIENLAQLEQQLIQKALFRISGNLRSNAPTILVFNSIDTKAF